MKDRTVHSAISNATEIFPNEVFLVMISQQGDEDEIMRTKKNPDPNVGGLDVEMKKTMTNLNELHEEARINSDEETSGPKTKMQTRAGQERRDHLGRRSKMHEIARKPKIGSRSEFLRKR